MLKTGVCTQYMNNFNILPYSIDTFSGIYFYYVSVPKHYTLWVIMNDIYPEIVNSFHFDQQDEKRTSNRFFFNESDS